MFREADRKIFWNCKSWTGISLEKKNLLNYDEYQKYIAEDEFIIDAEIDQSLKVLVD